MDRNSGTIRRCSRSTLHTHTHTHTHIHIHIHIHAHIHTLSTRSTLPSPLSPFIPQDPALRVKIISSGPETGSQLKQHAFWWAWQSDRGNDTRTSPTCGKQARWERSSTERSKLVRTKAVPSLQTSSERDVFFGRLVVDFTFTMGSNDTVNGCPNPSFLKSQTSNLNPKT